MDKTNIELAFSQQLLINCVAEQNAIIERNKLAILELLVRKSKNETNIEAANKYIESLNNSVPVKPIELQRRKMDIANQNATIERQIMENLEGEERIQKHLENIGASVKAKQGYVSNLADMEKAHGILVDGVLNIK